MGDRSSTSLAIAVLLHWQSKQYCLNSAKIHIRIAGNVVLFFQLGVAKDRNKILGTFFLNHFLSVSHLRICRMNLMFHLKSASAIYRSVIPAKGVPSTPQSTSLYILWHLYGSSEQSHRNTPCYW